MNARFPALGRHALGLSGILFGVSGLAWGDFAYAWHPVQPSTPHRVVLAYIAAIAFLASGLAVQWRRTERAGLIALATLYLLGGLLWMPRMIHYTRILGIGVWNGFAEEFAMVAAVLLVLAAARTRAGEVSMEMRIARVLFGLCSVSFGLTHYSALAQTAAMVPAWLPPDQKFWALATGTAMLLAGVSLVSGIMATQAAWLLTIVLASFEIVIWIPKVIGAPLQQISWGGNAITIAVAASALMVAEVLSRATPARAVP